MEHMKQYKTVRAACVRPTSDARAAYVRRTCYVLAAYVRNTCSARAAYVRRTCGVGGAYGQRQTIKDYRATIARLSRAGGYSTTFVNVLCTIPFAVPKMRRTPRVRESLLHCCSCMNM